MTDYLLDANVFIQAKNLHYGFDFCPAFWQWLVDQNHAGKVASIEKVADELYAGQDDLADWAKGRDDSFFLTPDDAVMSKLHTVGDWASTSGYTQHATATFLNTADSWLIAHALAQDYVVVTHEVRADTSRKVKIPNACDHFYLQCITPFEMLRDERDRFVLDAALQRET